MRYEESTAKYKLDLAAFLMNLNRFFGVFYDIVDRDGL